MTECVRWICVRIHALAAETAQFGGEAFAAMERSGCAFADAQ